LEQALGFYHKFLARNRDRQAARVETGKALFRIARLQEELGNFAKARRAYQQALALWKGLAKADPREPGHLLALARIYRSLGGLYRGRDDRAAAAGFQNALAVLKDLEARFPDLARSQRQTIQFLRARTLSFLGIQLRNNHRDAQAAPCFQEAEVLFRELVRKKPSRSHRYGLAHCRNNQGLLLKHLYQFRQSIAATREAEGLYTDLYRQSPQNAGYRGDLAATRSNLGLLFQYAGNPAEAEKKFEAAIALYQGLVEEYSQVFEYRHKLGRVQGYFAALLLDQDRLPEAHQLLQQAIRHQRIAQAMDPNHSRNRYDLSESYRQLGKVLGGMNRWKEAARAYDEALALAKQLRSSQDPFYRVRPAEILSSR